ncbi:ASCH domain-containing protein [Maritalea sp.]|uniref:ASCH domain-containing protein n=1 Tax=Maritalea sp. TaxID=2003361 RepID=UPI003EFA9CF6
MSSTSSDIDDTVYIVTDIETDGPSPLRNSMLSFASVAMNRRGDFLGEFEVVLEPRADRASDPETMQWWETEPEAYKAATTNALPPEKAMAEYVNWVESFDGRKAFASAPLIFDGPFVDHYLDQFANTRVFGGPGKQARIFAGGGVDIYSVAGMVANAPHENWTTRGIPDSWIGNQPHTHFAIDDARGFAHLLKRFFIVGGLAAKYRNLECAEFGDGQELRDALVELIVSGKKTATCGSFAIYEEEGEPLPKVGERFIVPDWAGNPKCIIETISVEVKRFDEVDQDFARAEGEGDLSFAFWRDAHIEFFTRNGGYSPDMKLVCERFELIEAFELETTKE